MKISGRGTNRILPSQFQGKTGFAIEYALGGWGESGQMVFGGVWTVASELRFARLTGTT